MKPSIAGNGGGWHRVEVEAVAYRLNRLLGMDYVPPTVHRTNADCDWQSWPSSVFMYWAEAGQALCEVPMDAWAGIPSAVVLSDARVLDVLLHNSDRCHDHLMMARHWALGEPSTGSNWRGQQQPVLIDHAAGFRPGAEVRMEQDNAFLTGPTTVVSARTLQHLRCVVLRLGLKASRLLASDTSPHPHMPCLVLHSRMPSSRLTLPCRTLECSKLTEEVGGLITSHELDDLMRRRDGIVGYFDQLVKRRGADKVLL